MSQTEKWLDPNFVEDIPSQQVPPLCCKMVCPIAADGPKHKAIAAFWRNGLMAQETEEPQEEEKHILLGLNHDWKI